MDGDEIISSISSIYESLLISSGLRQHMVRVAVSPVVKIRVVRHKASECRVINSPEIIPQYKPREELAKRMLLRKPFGCGFGYRLVGKYP